MFGRPFRSKLMPFESLIREWRKVGKTYVEISALLKAEHGLEAHPDTINSFVKVRAKRAQRMPYVLPEQVPLIPSELPQAVFEELPMAPMASKPYIFIPQSPSSLHPLSEEDLQFNDLSHESEN